MLSKRLIRVWLGVSVVWLMSCINTSYSRLDEVEITGNELDLILGQFAHHGEHFYKHEVARTKEILAKQPDDFMARNDLASAYIKLKQYTLAEKEFDQNERLHPKKYQTAANRGVLYKKMGEYEKAAHFISQSLEIKKEGHMGLGDYYLRMIQWLDEVKKDPGYVKNFLGVEYLAGTAATVSSPAMNKEFLLTLIKNDYQFADVYFVLGDVYFQEGEYQLAIRSYHRANYLGHHFEDEIYGRLNAITNKLEAQKKAGQLVEKGYLDTSSVQVIGEIEAAERWLRDYQRLEAGLILEGKAVDFKSMKGELKKRGVKKPKVIEAMIYKGEILKNGEEVLSDIFTALIIAIIIILLVLFLIVRMICKRRYKPCHV